MRYSFDTYKPANESQTRALQVAQKASRLAIEHYADESVVTEPAIIVFSGSPGVGKTHLLESIRKQLDSRDIPHTDFNGAIPPNNFSPVKGRIIIGDDAFSAHNKLSSTVGNASAAELRYLNANVLDRWYPDGSLVIMSSNFTLEEMQLRLRELDDVGRASSRLDEMARRGADVPITGADYRATSGVESLF